MINKSETKAIVISVDRSSLFKSLQNANSISGRRTIEGVVANIQIDFFEGYIEILASNSEVCIVERISCESSQMPSVLVMSQMFSDIVRKIPDGSVVNLEVRINSSTIDNGYLVISYALSEFKLPLSYANDASIIENDDQFKKNKFIEVKREDLIGLINRTHFAASIDGVRKFLCSVFIKVTQSEIIGVAIDGHRLSKMSYDIEGIEGYEKGFVISRKSIYEILKVTLLDTKEKIRMYLPDELSERNQIAFEFENSILYTSLMDQFYPDYQSVINKRESSEKFFQVDAQVLRSVLDRVSAVVLDKVKSVKIKICEGRIDFIAHSYGYGSSALESIDADYFGEEATITVNAKYILDIIDRINGSKILCYFNNSADPIFIYDDACEKFIYVLMPMVNE